MHGKKQSLEIRLGNPFFRFLFLFLKAFGQLPGLHLCFHSNKELPNDRYNPFAVPQGVQGNPMHQKESEEDVASFYLLPCLGNWKHCEDYLLIGLQSHLQFASFLMELEWLHPFLILVILLHAPPNFLTSWPSCPHPRVAKQMSAKAWRDFLTFLQGVSRWHGSEGMIQVIGNW